MSLTGSDVDKIAHLARLEIRAEDKDGYARDLSNILDLVSQMNAINTDDVVPMAHPQDVAQRLREDEVSETDRRAEFQAIAPKTEAGLYLVPKVIE